MSSSSTSLMQRCADIGIVPLDTTGFDLLEPTQKRLAYHLARAGLWGRRIAQDQVSVHNVPLMDAMFALYQKIPRKSTLYESVEQSLFMLCAHNGMYHSTSGQRLDLPINLDLLDGSEYGDEECSKVIVQILRDKSIAPFKTVQTEGADVVRSSGGNFYRNLDTNRVQAFWQSERPQEGEMVPPYGYNWRLVGNEDGSITKEVLCATGRHAAYFECMIEELQAALPYTENAQQHASIATLIKSLQTGNAEDFDEHCVAWVKDVESSVYFIHGLIESYDDPLGVGCTFESIVAFKNPLQTAKVKKITENIQWFEDNQPFEEVFKKKEAVGLSASSITVVSMAGDASPILPLGVNLPNSDWIRQKHGSKSVNLHNVASGRSVYDKLLREALYLPKYHEALETYGLLTDALHTDLHEIAGHGSGCLMPGVSTDTLGAYYSTIEEARADLVALYFMGHEHLQKIGIYDETVDVGAAATAAYVSYLTNGYLGQLRRVTLGCDLTQPHMRNRHLIAKWVLDHADPQKVCCVKNAQGHTYIEVLDYLHVQDLVGQLLAKVQHIKSTANFEAAKDLVMQYGTQVNGDLHKEILERISVLDIPKTVGFMTPVLTLEGDSVRISQPSNFLSQQLWLHESFKM